MFERCAVGRDRVLLKGLASVFLGLVERGPETLILGTVLRLLCLYHIKKEGFFTDKGIREVTLI